MAKQSKPAASPFDALVQARRAPLTEGTIQTVKQLNRHTSEQLNVQTSDQPDGQLVARAKSTDPDFLKFTTYIRKDTHRAVKVKIVEQGREFSDLVEELLSAWLQRQQQENVG